MMMQENRQSISLQQSWYHHLQFSPFALGAVSFLSVYDSTRHISPWVLFQSGISMDTTGTTHLAGYSCTTGLRCGSIEVSSWGGLVNILSENLQEMFPYSWRKGHVPSRKSQKSFRIPNHPVKMKYWNKVMIQTL